jgi:multiple sugar transport system substrate-binding protein
MSTAKFLSLIFAILIALSVLAYFWRPSPGPSDKIPLVWVSDNNPARTAQINAFNQEHPDTNLVLDFGNGGTQKIVLQAASGVGPDIFDYSSDDLETLAAAGVLWNVTEAAEKMGFSMNKDLWPSGRETLSINGQQYGYPCNIGANIIVFNKNVFDHFGVPYPKGLMTWDEFLELAKKVNSITVGEPGGSKSIFAVSGLTWRFFFDSMRGEFFTEDGRLDILDSPALTTAFQMHKDYLFTYRIMPTAVETKAMSGQGGWGGGNLNQFASNRFAMVVTGHWSLIAFNNAYKQSLDGLKSKGIQIEDIKNPLDRPLRIGGMMIPKFADREPSYLLQSRVAGINAKSPNREKALEFLQYLAGPVYSKFLNEGTDWLPGNPKYASLGVEPGPPDLDRVGLQEATTEAVAYGYCPRVSPFLLKTDVLRVLNAQISRLESSPEISVASLLKSANDELLTSMRRNLDRDPDLKKMYIERFGEASYKQLP